MNKKIIIACFAGSLLASVSAFGQEKTLTLDQVVITATKFDKKSSETGKVVRVITLDELEKFKGRGLVEILNDQAGMVINNAYGAKGNNLSYYLRGAEPKYTAIQIDGIPVADPSGISTFFDLNTLSLDQVERIEILRGANSTLHGSGAVAGVINIITKKGGNRPISVDGVLSAGSYESYRGNANLSGSLSEGLFDYNIGYSYSDSKGFSSAKQPDTASSPYDEDGFTQHALNANFRFRPADGLTLKPFIRYSNNDFENDRGAFMDGPSISEKQFLQSGLGLVNYLKDRGQWILAYSFTKFDREIDDAPGTGEALSFFDGQHHNAETYLSYRINPSFQFIAGLDFNALESDAITPYGEISSDSASMNYGSAYASVFYSHYSGFNLEVGGRFNRHSLYGNNGTYTVNPSFLINPDHKVFVNIASAFRVPVLDELYAVYGNPELEPETSQSYEAGYEGVVADDRLKIALTAFKRDVDNVITFGTNRYINFDRQEDYGAELELETSVGDLTAKAFYAFVDGETSTADTSYHNLYKRPKHSAGLRLGYQFTPEFYLALNTRYMGERTDIFFAGSGNETITLEPFVLLDAYAQYRINEHFKLFADLKNITDADYIETTGYTTRGFNFNAGLSLSF